jgi:hypothetical protein
MRHLKPYRIFERIGRKVGDEIPISDQNLIKEIFLDVFDNFLNDNCFNFSKPEDFFPIDLKYLSLTYTYKYYSNRNSLIFSMIIIVRVIGMSFLIEQEIRDIYQRLEQMFFLRGLSLIVPLLILMELNSIQQV